MSNMKAAKSTLRKDIQKTIALLTPEQKKCQSDLVTEKVSAVPRKTQRLLFTY